MNRRSNCPGPFQDVVAYFAKQGHPPDIIALTYNLTTEEVGDILLQVRAADEAAAKLGETNGRS